MKKINVGIIGCGFIGEAHMETLRRIGNVEIVALVENNLETARQKSEKNYIPQFYDDYMKLLNDPNIDVIHNCTPNNLHNKINLDAIKAGKHIFSEKPLSMNSVESRELSEAAKKAQIVNGVNFNYRQYPLVQEMKCRVETGHAGEIYTVHGHYLQDWMLYDTDYNWRINPEIGGISRAIADIGSHWCDVAQTVTGKRITEVMADLSIVHPYRKRTEAGRAQTFAGANQYTEWQWIKIDTEDYGGVLLRFEDGSRGIFFVSQVSAGKKNCLSISLDCANYSMGWNQEDPDRLMIGHRNKANECLMRDSALLSENVRSYCHLPGGHGEAWFDGLKNSIEKFYQFIMNGKNPTTDKTEFATFEDGHRVMCIVEAILHSSKERKWVKVNYT